MKDWYSEASARLEAEAKKVKGNKESAMRDAVKSALLDFCRQDEEFAQAVAQGGSFPDCMKAVAKDAGTSISDLDAYRKAVNFYFPGADIHMMMRIDLCASVRDDAADETPVNGAGEAPRKSGGCINLKLSDYL